MAEKLTPQQKQAVYSRGGNLLVSAAAGSGKTKVLVDRLLNYLTDEKDPANLDEFLIITYTKAAASELRGKIAAKLTEKIAQEPQNRHLQKQMQRLFLTKISTVHGFCGDLLREYAYKLDIPADFRVADDSESREIRDMVLAELMENAYKTEGNHDFLAFVDTQGVGRNDLQILDIIEKVYDSARCHLNPHEWLEKCLQVAALEHTDDVSMTVWGDYLIADLKKDLISQIDIFRHFAQTLDACEGLEKPAVNIRDTLHQLEKLYSCQTWDDIVAKKNIDYGRLVFPKKNNPDPELTDRVKAARNACKKGLERKLESFTDGSEQILLDMAQTSAATRGLVALVQQFEKDYQAAKRSRRILDFSDLEHKTLDLLLGKNRSFSTMAAKEIGRRYREIMVDEYQDSNGVQDAIFAALTEERQNCFLVGDVKQSIYQFRLADPGIFLEKYHRYVPEESALPGEGRKVLLSHNFRSGAEVIEGVNEVFAHCMTPDVGGLYYTDAEALREGIPHECLPEAGVELYAIDVKEDTYSEEAAFVAAKIRHMLKSETRIRKNGEWAAVQPEDIVILLRSPGSAGSYFQRALEAQGIRCSSGGGTNLLQTEEIGTLRSLLQTIQNPRLDIPLLGIMASPVFGFSANELAEIRAQQKKGSFYDALLAYDNPKVQLFIENLTNLRQEARMSTLSVLLERCMNLTRIDSIYGAMTDGDAKRENLQTFYKIAVDYEKGNLRDLGQFLEYLDIMEERGLATTGAAASGCVNIMSIHKSKGLEFPVVFLSNLSRRFNQESIRGQILCDKELGLGLSIADHESRVRYPSVAKRAIAAKMAAESVSEEMRVLYVAMTRARDRLIMTYAAQKLESDLQDISLRLDFDGGKLLSREATCLGDWVLITALQKTEAGKLHALGGRPLQTTSSLYPWHIEIVQSPETDVSVIDADQLSYKMPENVVSMLKDSLSFQYSHQAATAAPSKQTATDRKGRIKDAEAAEDTQQWRSLVPQWRKPSFVTKEREGKAYGSAIHAAMQYIRYENCRSLEAIREEINHLVEHGFLSAEQGELVNCELLYHFFASEIGGKLRSGTPYLREFKFSILDDGTHYNSELEGEEVLLQGVVDCALLESDGITVLDFKTDNVTEDTLEAVTARYHMQVRTYAEALSRIYKMPIKAQYLYFFRLNRFIAV